MQLYDATNKNGICQEIDRLCDTTDTSYTRADKTSRVNQSYEEVVAWIINADGTWQFDDSNKSDQPRGVLTLVEGQQAYTFASDYLQIEMMEVKDTNGHWIKIEPLDHSELGDQSPDQYFGVDTSSNPNKGFPRYFDLFTDDSFRLYLAPTSTSVTLSGGLRVTFKRSPTLFTLPTPITATTDDSTVPGFAAPFHIILAYMAALPYCATYKKDRVAWLAQKIGDTDPASGLKKQIIKHYSLRNKAERKIMRPKLSSYV